jgi:hypothetical protein
MQAGKITGVVSGRARNLGITFIRTLLQVNEKSSITNRIVILFLAVFVRSESQRLQSCRVRAKKRIA